MTDSYKGLRILIIEDNPGDQYLITELLQATVIKIQSLNTAETLGNAIDILQKEIFDIILLDLSLPDSSGINTFKAIKKAAGKIPVVILSGLTDMNIAVEAITLGAQDYHIKGDLDEKTLTQTILYSIERKRRLEDLRESSERYITISKADLDLMQSEEITRQIMNAALDAIVCTDTYGKIIFWNPQAEKTFGWKQQEILGRTLTETIIPVEFREKHEKVISHYLATGEGATLNKLIEVTAVNRMGHHFPAELTTIPLTENGNLFFCAFIRDISERKKAENAQRESEETFRRLFNESADSVLLLDDTGFTDCNQSAVSIFGYSSKQEVLNKKPWDISPERQPDGRLSTEKAEAMIAKALQQGYNRFEWVHIKSAGTEFPVEVMLTSIILKGKQSFYALLRDITERKKAELALKKSEEKYRTLFEQSPAGIYQTTLKGKIITCNDAFAIMLGYRSFADLPEKNSSWFYFSDAKRDTSITELQEKGELINHEIKLKHKDGNPVYLIENCFLRKDTITGEDIIEGMMIDITERKKSAIALRESEEKYRTFFENSMDGILLTAPDGTVLSANPAACNMFIMTEQEICRAGRSGLVDKEDSRLANLLQQRLQTGKATGELIFIRKNGSKFSAEVSSSIFIDAAGKEKTSMIIRDITERKKNEEALIKSELYLRGTLDSTNDGILAIDNNGKVITTNNRFAELWHIPEELISQKDDRKLLEYVLGQLIDPEAFLSKVRDLYNSDRTGFDMLYFRDNRVFERYSTPLILNQNIVGRVWSFRDITEQKKAEATLKASERNIRQVLSSTSDYFYVIDINCRITLINEAAEKDLTIAWGKPVLIGVNILDVIPPESYERVKNNLEQVFAGKKIEYELNTTIDGLPEWLLVNYIPVNDDSGTIIGASIVAKDITKRKKAEQEVKDSEEKYRTLIEQASDPILIYSLDGRMIDYNNALMSATGYQKEDIENLKLTDLLFEEDLKNNPLRFGRIKNGIAVHDERRVKRKDGSATYIELNSKMMPDGNIMVIARDISDRKKAEEQILKTNARFHVLSKATSDIVWDWNMLDGSLWWNDNYYSLLGIKKEKEITEINDWYNRIHPDDLNRIRKDVEKGIRDNVTFWSHEYRFKKDDGTYLHFLDRSFIMRNRDGQPYRMIGSMVNMTPIYEAQKVVAESENRLRTIYETEPECIKLLGPEGELLEMNPAGLAMIEADNLEMVKGKSVLGIVAPAYRKAFDKLTRDVYKGKSGTLEFEVIGLKGTHRWLETHAVPMRDAAGHITALLGVTRNITERKKAEQAVKESEEKYRTMIEQAPDGIFISDQDAFLVDVNTSGCIMLGYSKEELLKMKYLDLISPESLKNNPIRFDDLMSGKIVLSERKIIRKDGSEISVEINAKLRSNGLIQSFIRDVTDRNKAEQAVKESEEKYRTLVEQAVDAIALYDATGKILDVNTGSVNLLGYTKEELMQMSLSDVLTAEEIKSKPVQYDVLQKGNSTVKQRKMKRKDKSIVETEVRSQQLPDGRFLSVIRDLTDRKKAEQELEDSYVAIRRLTDHLQNIREEERAHIAREIHDELGQQLTVMKMDISWINKKLGVKDESVNTRIKELLSMLDETVKSVRRISSELRPSLLDDLGLTAAMEWQLSEFEKRFGIKAHFKFEDAEMKLPETIKTGLFRIFQESLTNVARHSKTKKVAVTLTRENSSIVLSIADDGVGFDKQKAAAKKTLGILGMKERTAMIGGTYEIISSPGKGTRVVVKIPLGDRNKN